MFKNPMSKKLFSYFSAIMLLFSFIVGIIFMILFKNHAIALHKQELLKRANSITQTFSGYLEEGKELTGFGAYMRFIEDIAGSNVWVIDKDFTVLTTNKMMHSMQGMNGLQGMGSMHGKMSNTDGCFSMALPKNAESIVEKVFQGNTVYSQEFSNLLAQTTLTLGSPIYTQKGEITAVLLLHSPVTGTRDAISQGFFMLLFSIAIGLLLSFLLSMWLSKRFTDPILIKEARDAIKLEKIRRDFVANVSHELRTPITVIKGSVEALKDGIVTEQEKIADYHEQILLETNYLQNMVQDLLELSKLQNADFLIEKAPVNLIDILTDTLRSTKRLAERKGIHIETAIAPTLFLVIGDYNRLRQMLIILLDNAIKFSNPNGYVQIVLERNVLSIMDNGIGIVAEELPYLFDRFHKSRDEANKEGSGLGLAIAKQIADRHDIPITVESDLGVGTTFRLTFSEMTQEMSI